MSDPSALRQGSGQVSSEAAAAGGRFIAIDGPSGSGKSSVSREVARRRGYGYLDTGSAYRALAWVALDRGIDTDDEAAVLALMSELDVASDIALSIEPGDRRVFAGEADITAAIREPRVAAAVSGVARVAEVRTRVNEMFRDIVASAPDPAVVVEGRDITTVVAPDAPVRILLTAHPDVRAARRARELDGDTVTVGEAMRKRDASDSMVVDFLSAAEGVTVVDSTELNFEQTVDAVLAVIDQKMGARDGC